MIAFIIPLKPKSQSKNWENDCLLLQQTISSISNQECKQFKIYLVYSDKPEIILDRCDVELVSFPYAFPSLSDIPDASSIMPYFNNDSIMLLRRWDKSRKIFYGCKKAKEEGCSYLMSVDSDDLLSRNLSCYISKNAHFQNAPGFYIEKGFLFKKGSGSLITIDEGMQNYNGSTHILRADLVKIPDFSTGVWVDYNLFTSHGWIISRIKELYGLDLKPIPFPAVIYVYHDNNISKGSPTTLKERVKYFLKMLLSGQKITADIKKEFSLKIID